MLHIERKIAYGKIICIVQRNIWAYGKELHTKEDIYRGDVETEEDVIDLLRGYSHEANVQSI